MSSARIVAMLTEILIIVALILANGVFAGAEIAVVAQRRTRLFELAESGRYGARALLALRDNPERFLATTQIGITVVGATAAGFGGASLAERLEPWIARVEWLAPYASTLSLSLVIAAVAYLSIVIGELVPKSLALRAGERYALLLARPMQILSWLATPLVQLLTASSNLVLRPFGDHTSFTETRHSAAEVMQIVEEAMQAGTVHDEAGEIATRALELPDLTAVSVMVPRKDVILLPRHGSLEELRETLLKHRYSRLPVYGKDIDDVVGYVTLKDVLGVVLNVEDATFEAILRPPYFVAETQRALDVLRDMRERRNPFGIVIDEQGSMTGIITLEDILEELVGEIYNEHAGETQQLIQREGVGTAVVGGSVSVREVNRELELNLPENGSWTTMGGLCIAYAGRIPVVGDVIELPEGVRLEVIDASPRRIRTLRVCAPVASM